MNKSGSRSMLRVRAAHQHHRVTAVELFFDLVFVFAVTQISHALLKDFSLLGAARVTLLFLAVWWVWIFTSWVTNWLDPDRTPVRILLFLLMLGGLVLSTSLPAAFGTRGLAFGLAFAAMQVGRSAVTLWLLPASEQGMRRNFIRILAWLSASAPETLNELIATVARAERILVEAYHTDGLNVGINFGSAAGAGIAGHYHVHVVPRWKGDTNFMTVTAGMRVVPEELSATRRRLAPLFEGRREGES